MRALGFIMLLVPATVFAANEVQWTLTGPPTVRQGDLVTWQASVTVTGDNQGLAGYVFDIVVGPSPGPSPGPDGQWGTADDENVIDVQLAQATWVPSFRVQGAPNAGSVKDTGNAGGPGMNVLPSAGNNELKKGELLQIGAGHLAWTPFAPPGQDGQTAGVGLDSQKSSLLANPIGNYVIHSGTIPTANLPAGAYTAMLIPLRTRVLRPDLGLGQSQAGFLMMTASGVGSSFEFTVGPGVAADFNKDGHVDGADFTIFLGCVTGPAVGPPPAGCETADLDGDGDVDQNDFGVFQRCFGGSNDPPACS